MSNQEKTLALNQNNNESKVDNGNDSCFMKQISNSEVENEQIDAFPTSIDNSGNNNKTLKGSKPKKSI